MSRQPSRICFAVLAHERPECLADLVANLRTVSPTCDVVLFDGGADPDFRAAAGIDVCPYSEPLRWGKLEAFQFGIMRWLVEEQRPFDYLVTLDSDMLAIKPGLEEWLDRQLAHSAYLGVNFQQLSRSAGINARRYFMKWAGVWQPLLGTDTPYYALNAPQVFGATYVERLVSWDRFDELRAKAARSSVPILEEMLFATLAVALGCNPRRHPVAATQDTGPVRLRRRHTAEEIAAYRADPDIFFIHPVPMEPDCPERRLVRALLEGEPPPPDALAYGVEQHPARHRRRGPLALLPDGPRSALRDLYLLARRE